MYQLSNKHMEKYNLHPIYTKDEFSNLFYNNNFVVCYVFEDTKGNVVDFISYYISQSQVIKNNQNHNFIRHGNLFYYTSLSQTPYKLIKNILIVAKQNNIDVFNAMDIMENSSILRELNFDQGTGISHYYLYNWQIKPIKNMQCSLVLF